MNNDVNIKEILSDKIKTDEFIHNNQPLVLSIIKKICPHVLYTYERDDYVQEGLLSLYKAMLKYDKHKHNKFSTFAHIVIERKLKNKLKCEQNKISQCRPKTCSLNTKISITDNLEFIDILEDKNKMDDDILDKIISNNIYKTLYNDLNPTYQQILKYLINGLNQADIARKLNCSRENIRQKVKKIKEKAEKLKII